MGKMFIWGLGCLICFTANAAKLREIKCTSVPTDLSRYDIHLKPSANNEYEFKKCDPNATTFKCALYSDSKCSIAIKDLDGFLELSGDCNWPVQDDPLKFSFYPIKSTPTGDEIGRHMITISSQSDPSEKMFGYNYYCVYLN